MGKAGKKLGLLGILLGGLLSVSAVKAKAEEQFQPEPIIIASFEYKSNRPEPEYFGKTFRYNVWSDNTISQADKPRVKFSQRWFYDVDGDENFGKAEIDMLKSGKLVYMHPKFNKIANSQVRNVLEAMLYGEELKELELNEYRKLPGRILNEEEKRSEKEFAKIKEEFLEEHKEKDSKYKTEELPFSESGKKKTEKDKYTELSLLTQLNSNDGLDNFGGAVGIGFAPFRNKRIRLGALLDIGFGLDKTIDSYTASLSAGRSAYGTIKETSANSIGVSGELKYSPVFVGAGINYHNWITNVLEQILDSSGNIVKSNENAVPKSKISGKVYAGFEVPVGKNFEFGALAGYDGSDAYFGLRSAIKLNKRKK